MKRLPLEQQNRLGPDASASVAARWVAALVLLFLADAAQVLLLLPARTGELFAWPIKPAINAAILGSAYVAGSYFFVRVLIGAPWRLVAGGYPPVIAFVWLACAATLLHLDRLNDEGLPLAAWVALYLVTPLLVPMIYLTNRSRVDRSPATARLPDGVRTLLGASGGAILVLALIAFVSPDPVIGAWPWPSTPLTLRVGAAVFALYGTVSITVAARGDAAGARIPLESQAIGLTIVLVSMLRAGDAVDWQNPIAPILAVIITALLAIGTAVHASLSDPPPHGSARAIRYGRIAAPFAFVGLAAAAVVLFPARSQEPTEPGDRFSSTFAPVPTNRVTGEANASVRINGTTAEITVDAKQLLDAARHLMHIHAGALGRCPPASAAKLHRGHRTISTLDGGPFYGKPVTSLTTHGDTGTGSFLDFGRFPGSGTFHYSRTARLSARAASLIRRNNAVILIHGIDYNANGVYDGDLDRSDLDRKYFGEATAPALCGALRAEPVRRGSATRVYVATLRAAAAP